MRVRRPPSRGDARAHVGGASTAERREGRTSNTHGWESKAKKGAFTRVFLIERTHGTGERAALKVERVEDLPALLLSSFSSHSTPRRSSRRRRLRR